MINTLNQYSKYYVRDENHWYVSKVKQFQPKAINEMAKALKLFSSLLKIPAEENTLNKFIKFSKSSQKSLFKNTIKGPIQFDKVSKLYLSLELLTNNLIDLSHLESVNATKFQTFNNIASDFLIGNSYEQLINKYGKKYIETNLSIYSRNFISWLKKLGFCGLKKQIFYTTEVGLEFSNNCDDKEITYT